MSTLSRDVHPGQLRGRVKMLLRRKGEGPGLFLPGCPVCGCGPTAPLKGAGTARECCSLCQQ